eukprot:TRINITY_DN1202_c0_g1_i3.p1 TRINITY_DN1202_c0_g1~~TRINITY_DN1202_c0_g1_i3.p1  ORF type:complete len:386 (-),score=85.96 TRINITY_DN1202_c0_g1_i3:119-1276(-)
MTSEEENVVKNPDLELAQLRFLVSLSDPNKAVEAKYKLLAAVQEHNMTPFYLSLCEQFKWEVDSSLVAKMKEANTSTVAKLDTRSKEAEEVEGENEIREALLAKAEHYCRIGDKDAALAAFQTTTEKTVSLGQRLDIVFTLIRIGFFYSDHQLLVKNIEKATSLVEEGGDWDRRNRLKVYEATYNLSIRNFSKAAALLLETLATFTSYELMDYKKFIFYTVLTSILSLDRPTLKKKVIDAPEILTVIETLPHIGPLVNSLYKSDYKKFFQALAEVIDQIKQDWLLAPHSRYICRELRVKAYAQLLESYRSVTMESLAADFGISIDFLDRELSRFIASGRLHCKVDKVSGIVETNRPDSSNAQYQATIKQGDALLNRIQKLHRVVV